MPEKLVLYLFQDSGKWFSGETPHLKTYHVQVKCQKAPLPSDGGRNLATAGMVDETKVFFLMVIVSKSWIRIAERQYISGPDVFELCTYYFTEVLPIPYSTLRR